MKLKRGWYVFCSFFKIGLCLAISLKRSRRELSIDVAEHRHTLKQPKYTILQVLFHIQNKYSVPRNGGFVFTVFERSLRKLKNPSFNIRRKSYCLTCVRSDFSLEKMFPNLIMLKRKKFQVQMTFLERGPARPGERFSEENIPILLPCSIIGNSVGRSFGVTIAQSMCKHFSTFLCGSRKRICFPQDTAPAMRRA